MAWKGKGNHRQFVGPGNSVVEEIASKACCFMVCLSVCVFFVEPFCLLKRRNTTTDLIWLFTSNIWTYLLSIRLFAHMHAAFFHTDMKKTQCVFDSFLSKSWITGEFSRTRSIKLCTKHQTMFCQTSHWAGFFVALLAIFFHWISSLVKKTPAKGTTHPVFPSPKQASIGQISQQF